MVKVAVLDDYQGIANVSADWKSLPAGTEVTYFKDHIADEGPLAERLKPFDVIVGQRERTPFQRSLLQKLPNLKLLITTGGRNASFDVGAANEQGVTVCGTGGAPSSVRRGVAPTAEIAFGLILNLVRHMTEEDRIIRGGGWQSTIGPGLGTLTLGLMGLGNLGSQVASIGKVFGMDTIAWSTNLTKERAEAAGARLVTKDELMAQSDVISIHLILGPRSRGLIGARELALMKPTAYLVNTSRGPIVDEKALIDALEKKQIGGAGLDVYDVEPLPLDHPFRRLANTVLTPHIGYVTNDGYKNWFHDVVEDIAAFLSAKPIRVLEPMTDR